MSEEEIEETTLLPQMYPDLIRYILSSERELEELEHNLKGETRIGRKWVKTGRPLLNKDGIKDLLTFVAAHLSKTLRTSNLSEEDVRRIALEIRENFIDLLFLKWKQWDVKKEKLSE